LNLQQRVKDTEGTPTPIGMSALLKNLPQNRSLPRSPNIAFARVLALGICKTKLLNSLQIIIHLNPAICEGTMLPG